MIYNEYFQWSPENNINSAQHNVNPGDELFGSITYDASTSSYNIYHNSSDGWSVTTNIPVQKKGGVAKIYNIAYFVYEKVRRSRAARCPSPRRSHPAAIPTRQVAPCGDYPKDEIVTFYDVKIQWDGVSMPARWSTSYVEDVCNFRAQVPNPSTSNGTVTITWSTTAEDPKPELIAASQADRKFGRMTKRA